jgi:steroid delta-isomerase-like uncharacterized protein
MSEGFGDTGPLSAEGMAANIALLRRWIDVGWNQRDTSIVSEVFHEDIITEGSVRTGGSPIVGRQAVIEFNHRMIQTIPDLHIEIVNLQAAGEIVIAEYRITGTHVSPYQDGAPAPGDEIVMLVAEVARFKDGLIAHRRDVISDARSVKERFGVK